MTAPIARRIRVRGRVQGVGFRTWAEGYAQSLDLSGWVRNRLDGSLELLLIGPSDRVEAMIDACARGPGAATVNDVEVESALGIAADGFTVKPTV